MRMLIAAAALAATSSVAHAASISTLDNDTIFINVSGGAEGTGDPNFGTSPNTYGQSFTVDSKMKLNSFSFKIENLTDPTVAVVYNAYLFNWVDGELGTQVMDFGEVTTTGTTPDVEMTGLDVSIYDIILEAGKYAILYESVSGGPAGWGATTCIGSPINCSNAYDGGEFLFSTSFETDDDDNDDSNEFLVSQNLDSAFVIDLEEVTMVPLAASMPLLAVGLVGLGALGWRRRRS